jgi:hypothetical protein
MDPTQMPLPFAVRYKSAINLVVAVTLLIAAIAIAVVSREPRAFVPLLFAGLAALLRATGERSAVRELSQAFSEQQHARRTSRR